MLVELLNIDYPRRAFDLDHPPFDNFDVFDSDENSVITFEEWTSVCQTKLKMTEQKGTTYQKSHAKFFIDNPDNFKEFIIENFRVHDQDGNGLVSMSEFPFHPHDEF